MDKKPILKWEIFGAIFIIIAGTLLHFVFDWSGQNPIVGIFSPVNESVWEHLKLGFWPLVLFSAFEFYFLRKAVKNFFFTKVGEACLIVLLTTSFFYTYTGILGFNVLPIDIGTFVFSVIIGQIISYKFLIRENQKKPSALLSLITFILLIFAFALFTFDPPKINLFLDPQGFGYGMDWPQQHK